MQYLIFQLCLQIAPMKSEDQPAENFTFREIWIKDFPCFTQKLSTGLRQICILCHFQSIIIFFRLNPWDKS